ncbi:MAG: hypothetical protein KKF77_14945, partial [Proteobacteria bacterium]|nr:hypothetical protein [Pseudomonadota bacterium]
PYYRYVAANLPWFRPAGAEGLGRLAENLASELCLATRFARNVAVLHRQADRGVAVPVLCSSQEEQEALAGLARLRPGWSWRCLGIKAPTSEGAAPSAGFVELAALHDWMRSQEVLVISPACAREFHYALSLIAGENVLDLEELLGYAPQC